MTFDIGEDGTVTLFPVMAYSAGIFDGVVGLRLDFAPTGEHYAAGRGEAGQFALTPEAAIEIGRALIDRGELLMRPPDAVLS